MNSDGSLLPYSSPQLPFVTGSGALHPERHSPTNNNNWLGRRLSVMPDIGHRVLFSTLVNKVKKLTDYLIQVIKSVCQAISTPLGLNCFGASVSLNYQPTFAQKGSTCKLAALAMAHEYYAQQQKVDFLPLNKKLRTPGGKILIRKKRMAQDGKSSFRELSKAFGSVQGEITSPTIMEKIASAAGLNCEKTVKETFSEYKNAIISYLKAGIPVVIFLQVNGINFSPDNPNLEQWAEHGVLVTGFNARKRTFEIVSHGKIHEWPMAKIWRATSLIHTKRQPEIYARQSRKRKVTFRDINTKKGRRIHPRSKWTDIHQIYNSTSLRLTIHGQTYRHIKDVEALTPTIDLRKSHQGLSCGDHFRRTVMAFTPVNPDAIYIPVN